MMMTSDEFWTMADSARAAEQYASDKKLQYLRVAPLNVLRKIFVQYRFFTQYYIGDLALLTYKVPFGRLRSTLGDILNEELGEGDHEKSHPQIYDNFLRSIGVADRDLGRAHPGNVQILEEMRQLTLTKSTEFAIGLRGMGGECLCQTYLETMYKNFTDNPAIKALGHDNIDWEFWDIHAGEVDQQHVVLIRECLTELMDAHPETIDELAAGYWKAKRNYDRFWENIFVDAAEGEGNIVTSDERLAIYQTVKDICAQSASNQIFPVLYKDCPTFFGMHILSPEKWFLRAFCDTADKALTTRVAPDVASLLAPGFEVEPAPVIYGASRIRFSDVGDLAKLRVLVLHAYEDAARTA